MHKKIDVYDFDGTIYDGDSTVDFFFFTLFRNPRIIVKLPVIFWYACLYLLHIVSLQTFKSHFFSFVTEVKDIDKEIELFWGKKEKKINHYFIENMKKKKKTYVISASPEFLLKPVLKQWKHVSVIASVVDKKTGLYTGKNCKGEEKIKRLDQELKNYEIEHFYSDSLHDLPLANISKQSYFVTHGSLEVWDTDKIKGQRKNIWNHTPFQLSWLIMMYLLCVLVFFHISRLCHIEHGLTLIQILSILVPVVIYLFHYRKKSWKKYFVVFLYFGLCIGLPFLFSNTYDLTQDGNGYHKLSVAYLKNGWNPIYQSQDDYVKENNLPSSKGNGIWINHYPKSLETISAVTYHMTGSIESGKAVTTLVLLAMVFLVFSYLSIFLNKMQSFILSVLLALNPVVLAQLFNYYVDGLMGMCFAMEVIILLYISITKKQDYKIWLYITAICSLFVNLKFTGLLYSGLIAAVFYFYWLFHERKEKEWKQIWKRATGWFILVFVTAIFVVGSSSYIKNTITAGNPLYPLFGEGKEDIVTKMEPKSFNHKNSFEKFVISLFSKTENVLYGQGEPELKNPLQVSQSEIDAINIPDVRIAGFGPLSACFFILGTILLLIELYMLYRTDKKKLKYVILSLVCILLSCILVGESWWARYVPQLYFIPWMSLLLLCVLSIKDKRVLWGLRGMGVLVFLFLIMNSSFYLQARIKDLDTFQTIEKDLLELKNQKNVKLQLSNPEFFAYYYNLDDREISYQIVEEDMTENFVYQYYWQFKVLQEK